MQEVYAYIRKYQMIREKDRVIVGVSGGADSVCLLLILLEYRKQVHFDLKAVHVEHGIRGKESLEDAAYVEKLCRERQVEYECFHINCPEIAKEKHLTLEEAGRIMRYEIFRECLKKWEGNKIAVAHHQNDQAETMLFQMLRGSGLKGSAGIRPVRDNIIRPLLGINRNQIEEYLRRQKIVWREDATNQEGEYSRNSIRNEILPWMEEKINSSAVEHLCALGEELQETEDYLEQESQKAKEYCVCADTENSRMAHDETGKVVIDIHRFTELALLIRRRVIRICLKDAGCGLKDITREHIAMILRLTEMESGRCVHLPEGWRAEREFSYLVIQQKKERQEKPSEISLAINGITPFEQGRLITRLFPYEGQQILQKTYTKWLDYDKIKGSLLVRTRRQGDYLVINEQGGRKKLKAYLTQEKIPVSQKDLIPLICRGEEVLWVVGHRIGETGKVDEHTTTILEIFYEEEL